MHALYPTAHGFAFSRYQISAETRIAMALRCHDTLFSE